MKIITFSEKTVFKNYAVFGEVLQINQSTFAEFSKYVKM